MARSQRSSWSRRRSFVRPLRMESLEDRSMLATITVTSAGDTTAADSVTTLREAIALANADATSDTIVFDSSLNGQTITLTQGQLTITTSLTITGNGATNTIISGNDASRVFNVDDGTSLQQTVTISGLTIRNGLAADGGGVYNAENLAVSHVVVRDNASQNRGGGVFSIAGGFSSEYSTYSGNTAVWSGGAVVALSGTVSHDRDLVHDNSAATTGGIAVLLVGSSLTTSNTTIFGNRSTNASAGSGGVEFEGSTWTSTNDTITNNVGGIGAGAYVVFDTWNVQNTIIAGNVGGDVFGPAATGTRKNSIFGSVGSSMQSDAGGNVNGATVTDLFVLDGDGRPLLADNGGPTKTVALKAGSTAINAGDSASVPSGVTTDQRGTGFARIVGSAVDVGAFEFRPLAVNTPTSATIGALSATLGGTVTAGDETITERGVIVTKTGDDATPDFASTSKIVATHATAAAGTFTVGLSGLTSNTGYSYVAYAKTAAGTTYSTVGTFTTRAAIAVTSSADTTNANDGVTTLREAVALANADANSDEIFFSTATNQSPITLGGTQLTISTSMAIIGNGSTNTIVSGADASRVFYVDGGDPTSQSVVISGMTIRDGAGSFGGGVLNYGSLTLSHVVLADNSATSQGGAVCNVGTMFSEFSTYTGNSADIGGATYAASPVGSTTHRHDSIYGNTAERGAALYAEHETLLTTVNTTIARNESFPGASIEVKDATWNSTNDTITGNMGDVSAVRVSDSTWNAANTIIAGNLSNDLIDVEVVGSSGGARKNSIFGTTNINPTLVASGSNVVNATVADLFVLNQYSQPLLAENGGPTKTVALKAGSTAINAGDSASVPTGVTTDQRGTGFARIVGSAVDVGAFEYFVPPTVASPTSATIGAISATLGGTVTAGNETITERGVIVTKTSDDATPDFDSTKKIVATHATAAAWAFTVNVSGLTSNTGYSYVAYAKTATATTYSTVGTFTTRAAIAVTSSGDTTDANDGVTTLREAIALANADANSDEIVFTTALNGQTITLGGTELAITTSMAIVGNGATNTIVSGNHASRVFNVHDGTGSVQTVSISGLTIRDGSSSDFGGGVLNTENLTLDLVEVRDNATQGVGGGVYNFNGNVLSKRSLYSGNAAFEGGAVFASAGSTSHDHDLIVGNSATDTGGIIANSGATLSTSNTTIFGNASTGNGSGGGVAVVVWSTWTSTNDTITNNTGGAGAGVFVFQSTWNVRNTIVAGNVGGEVVASSGTRKNSIFGNAPSSFLSDAGGNVDGQTAADLFVLDSNGKPLLADNGGPTKTIALKAGSVAIDAGDDVSVPAGTTTDQRGTGFARVVGAHVDVGAFEFRPAAAVSPSSATVGAVSAILGGTATGDMTTTERGVIVTKTSDDATPDFDSTTKIVVKADTGDKGVFTFDVSGLTSNTAYSYVAYVKSAAGTAYSPVGTFTTRAPIVVTSAGDTTDPNDGVTTLREAIAQANADANSDEITFVTALDGQTITLGGTELAITTSMAIVGNGATNTIVSGNNASRVFNVDDGTGAAQNVTIGGVTIRNGQAPAWNSGGGIINAENLSLSRVIVAQNAGGFFGGGVQNLGTLVSEFSTYVGNTAFNGGATFTEGNGRSVTHRYDAISGNSASVTGGVYVGNSASMSTTNTTIAGNVSTSGYTGGVSVDQAAWTSINDTITNNTGDGVAGWRSQGDQPKWDVRNTIVVGNTLKDVVWGNRWATFAGVRSNSIFGSVGYSTLTDAGDNVDNATAADLFVLDSNGKPLLADNGGPTKTVALKPGSVAINAGDSGSVPSGVTTDQRGAGFARIVGSAVDIGAYEFRPVTVSAPTSTAVGANSVTLGGTVTGDEPITERGVYVVKPGVPGENGGKDVKIEVKAQTNEKGVFTFDVSGLKSNSTYSYYAYAKTANGTTQSSTGTFTTRAPITVTSAGDTTDANDGVTTLREAIALANADANSDEIVFATALNGQTIMLGGSELAITTSMTIVGNGATNTIVSANGTTRVFKISDGTETRQTVSIRGMTVRDGFSGRFQAGGAIFNKENLQLSAVVVANSSAGRYGGGVYSDGSLTSEGTTYEGNNAGERGGGLYTESGDASLRNDVVRGNSAATGGGIMAYSSGLTTTNTTVFGNTLGGGVVLRVGAGWTSTNDTITNNAGGAGVDLSNGSWTVANTIVAANNDGDVTLADVTGGSLRNSIFGSFSSTSSDDVVRYQDLGGLVYNATAASLFVLDSNNKPLLADNGGPTMTVALKAGSTAINAGHIASVPAGVTTDQRGTGFARIVGTAVDVGAFEFRPLTVSDPTSAMVGAVSATLGGTTTAGDDTITERGVIVTKTSDDATPDFDSATKIVATHATAAAGVFTVDVSGLKSNTGYSYVAYAKTAAGTTYSSVGTFTTRAPIVVNLRDDVVSDKDGATSLREALALANADANSDEIVFDERLNELSIELRDRELAVTTSVSIVGNGASNTIISGFGRWRVFNVDDGTSAMRTVSISGMTIRDGLTDRNGGAITNSERLALSRVVFDNNRARQNGGAVSNNGTLVSEFSTYSGNTADEGGATYTAGTGSSTTHVRDAIHGNSARNGAGVSAKQGSLLSTSNTTVFGNTSTSGSAVSTTGTTWDSTNDTITNNTGGIGAGVGAGATVWTVKNTIVAGNIGGDVSVVGTEGSRKNSIFGGVGNLSLTDLGGNVNNATTANLFVVDANGKPLLANNGGPTMTVALSATSIAKNVGDNASIPAGITTDQRGTGFDRIINGTVDVGAFEAPIAPITVTAPTAPNIGKTAATLGGSIAGDPTVTERGVIVTKTSDDATPDFDSAIKIVSTTATAGAGVFTVNVTGLTVNTAYSYVAYAKTANGTVYSTVGTFTTLPAIIPITVTSPTATLVRDTTVTLGATVAGDPTVTQRGVIVVLASASANPTLTTAGARIVNATPAGGTGAFAVNIATLTPGARYNFVAYARTAQGVTYSQVGSFMTNARGVQGTAGDDTYRIRAVSTRAPGGNVNVFSVSSTGVETRVATFAMTTPIVVYGNEGNDRIEVVGPMSRSVRFYGGAGNDILIGGSGGDVLVGGEGDDQLIGGGGRNILVGGTGKDVLFGAWPTTDVAPVGNENILIGDSLSYEANDAAMATMAAAWGATTGTNETRIARIRAGVAVPGWTPAALSNATVIDDNAIDQMDGTRAFTWFWNRSGSEILNKRRAQDVVN